MQSLTISHLFGTMKRLVDISVLTKIKPWIYTTCGKLENIIV